MRKVSNIWTADKLQGGCAGPRGKAARLPRVCPYGPRLWVATLITVIGEQHCIKSQPAHVTSPAAAIVCLIGRFQAVPDRQMCARLGDCIASPADLRPPMPYPPRMPKIDCEGPSRRRASHSFRKVSLPPCPTTPLWSVLHGQSSVRGSARAWSLVPGNMFCTALGTKGSDDMLDCP